MVIVDLQAKQDSLGSGQKLNIRGINVPKGTPGRNVETFPHVQVTIFLLNYTLLHLLFSLVSYYLIFIYITISEPFLKYIYIYIDRSISRSTNRCDSEERYAHHLLIYMNKWSDIGLEALTYIFMNSPMNKY